MAVLLPTELESNLPLPQTFTPMAVMPEVADVGKSWQLRRGRVQVMLGRYDWPEVDTDLWESDGKGNADKDYHPVTN